MSGKNFEKNEAVPKLQLWDCYLRFKGEIGL
jgi:hypothetical protein